VLEILFLVYLCKQLGRKLRAKGRSAGWFQFLLVVAWFAGEIMGAVVAAGVLDDGSGEFHPVAYLGALLGAACGATAVFLLARSLPGEADHGPPGFPVTGVVPPAYPQYPPGRDPGEL
jgi:hypothetical protein